MLRILLPIWFSLLAALTGSDFAALRASAHVLGAATLVSHTETAQSRADPDFEFGDFANAVRSDGLDIVEASADYCRNNDRLIGSDVEVCAAYETQSVSAYFGTGESRELTYDDGRQVWRARFPERLEDNVQTGAVLIALVNRDGSRSFRWMSFDPTRKRVPFYCTIDDDISAPGLRVRLHVDSIEPASHVTVRALSLGWNDETLHWQNGTQSVDWFGEFVIHDDARAGLHDALITVNLDDGTSLVRWVTLVVLAKELT